MDGNVVEGVDSLWVVLEEVEDELFVPVKDCVVERGRACEWAQEWLLPCPVRKGATFRIAAKGKLFPVDEPFDLLQVALHHGPVHLPHFPLTNSLHSGGKRWRGWGRGLGDRVLGHDVEESLGVGVRGLVLAAQEEVAVAVEDELLQLLVVPRLQPVRYVLFQVCQATPTSKAGQPCPRGE